MDKEKKRNSRIVVFLIIERFKCPTTADTSMILGLGCNGRTFDFYKHVFQLETCFDALEIVCAVKKQ